MFSPWECTFFSPWEGSVGTLRGSLVRPMARQEHCLTLRWELLPPCKVARDRRLKGIHAALCPCKVARDRTFTAMQGQSLQMTSLLSHVTSLAARCVTSHLTFSNLASLGSPLVLIVSRVISRVVGCCNGVIWFGYTGTIILWNPAIRRYLTLPRPTLRFNDHDTYMISLGFGFDPKTNDHKIIRIKYPEEAGGGKVWAGTPKVEVYALSTGLWKTVKGAKIGYHMVDIFWSSVYANGGVRWTAYSGGRSIGYCNIILVFDVGSELFREVKLPEKLVGECPLDLAVVAYRDSISVVQYDNRGLSSREVVVGKWDESLILLDGGNVVPMEDIVSSDGADDPADNAAVSFVLKDRSRMHYEFAAISFNPSYVFLVSFTCN
ncbi:hypothetical protein Vadar_024007 [Vaccinium darrowii]|uniref:Uncharacterized protein n=1 Tax=Vaccinium darrowii TaxID=229202 RepID=A0ACB7XSY5_9ERIC|nr:hypothetical protein Vadar_024007 [Vaccinium darrowii]